MNLQLLEACKAALKFIETYCNGPHVKGIIEVLQSAIDKADGKKK